MKTTLDTLLKKLPPRTIEVIMRRSDGSAGDIIRQLVFIHDLLPKSPRQPTALDAELVNRLCLEFCLRFVRPNGEVNWRALINYCHLHKASA